MGTLYFLLPILAAVGLLYFAISRINARSYLHGSTDATFEPRKAKVNKEDLSAGERLEHRYVDWYTTERRKSPAIDKEAENDEVFVGTATLASGSAYRPEERRTRRAANM